MSLHIPDHADFNFSATGKFYIGFDFKTKLTGSSYAIFRKLNSFLFRRVYNEEAQCYSFSLLTGLPEPQVYSFPIVAATKYYIKIMYDNSKYDLYVDDDKLEPSSYQDNAILESNDGFIFGYTHPSNSKFYVKDIKIYRINT